MRRASIPTADFAVFTLYADAERYIDEGPEQPVGRQSRRSCRRQRCICLCQPC
ncbi:MAG UNVERIFIED_CONTAM: hypothetical protein LVR18_26040 [Planctomycetaceae bacterium]